MRGTQCLNNSRRALYRVFVFPAAPREAALVPRQLLPLLHVPSCLESRQHRFLTSSAHQRRAVKGRPPVETNEDLDEENKTYDRRYTTERDIMKANRDRMPQDHEITDPQIMVIDNGPPEGPLRTRYVMSKLEAGECLRMLEPYRPADPKEGIRETFALCKIINLREEYNKQREIKASKKEGGGPVGKPKTKDIELAWSIGDHDLETKTRQMAGFLAKGMKVNLTIARKKRGREASVDEAAAVLKKIREEAGAAGAREAKEAEGAVGRSLKLYFEGKRNV